MDINGNLNPEGEKYYHHLFAVAKKVGIEIFVNLYHFDMPEYLFNRGGWESREVVEAYAHYARIAFEMGARHRQVRNFNVNFPPQCTPTTLLCAASRGGFLAGATVVATESTLRGHFRGLRR